MSRALSKGRALIYTDGACSRNGQGSSAKAGIGVFWPNNPENNISEPMDGRATNQRAEIEAARRGIEQARSQGYDEVIVRTDSQYVKNAVESWLPNWERSNWSRKVINKLEFQNLRDSMEGIKVCFEKVPSSLNAADPLARNGVRRS
uniref:ribonuclease H n=1 Tax=Aceria tosichella TaxID=561515 RepID=A0A6G1SA09_9ACAR